MRRKKYLTQVRASNRSSGQWSHRGGAALNGPPDSLKLRGASYESSVTRRSPTLPG